MTYEVQQTRWDRLIRRVSGSIGPGSRVSETISELFPVLDVERVPGELLLLGGIKTGQAATILSAVAGNLNHAQLFNPADSNNLVVLTKVYLASAVAQPIRFGTTATALTTDVGNVIPRDTRAGIIGRLSAESRSVNQVGGFPLLGNVLIQSNVTFAIEDENSIAVLAPGTGYTFANTAANSTLQIHYFWRERPAEQSELQF